MNRTLSVTRWLLLAVLAVGGLVVCALGWRWLQSQGYTLREAMDWVLAYVRRLGPAAFFTLMAVLPVIGAPLSIFTLTAGPLFAPTFGLSGVIALTMVSLAANLALTYVLARWLLRPWVERLCAWLGFKIPAVAEEDQRNLVILVRVTPGTPQVLQNYLLGVACIPFAPYFVISWVVGSLYACAFIVFGDAVVQGKGRNVLIGVGLLAGLAVGVRFLRRYMQRKKIEPAV